MYWVGMYSIKYTILARNLVRIERVYDVSYFSVCSLVNIRDPISNKKDIADWSFAIKSS